MSVSSPGTQGTTAVDQNIVPSLWRRVLGAPATEQARGLPPGERVYAVGDIHGQARLLREPLGLIVADIAARPTHGEERMARIRERLPPHHHAFVRALNPCARRGGYFFAHAGVRPGVLLDREDTNDPLTIRKDFHRYRRRLGAVVVHGRTAVREPEVPGIRINIDTGAYATGRLTAAVIEGEDVRLVVAEKMGCM